ncbi:hypothetical protein ACIBSV_33650 [Embleya sp. NPDC050154]|uniref:hypothetical protein n=1 Tax=Embleya sp. NPDC050154 TaxID=3363988 RepID=UPI003788F3F6
MTDVPSPSGGPVLPPGLPASGVDIGIVSPTPASPALAAAPAGRAGMAGAAVGTFRRLGFA